MTPPFKLSELEASITKHLTAQDPPIPRDVVRSIAESIFGRYAFGGLGGTSWHTQRVTEWEGEIAGFDLCRGEWNGGICFSRFESRIQALADALNELEGIVGPSEPV
jgi:hypothetical protein